MMAADRAPDVVIVGGGVMGCATAYYLAAAGVRVTLLEQHRIGGPPSASGASAAIVEALAGSPPPLARQAQLSRRLLADLAPQLLDATGIDVEYARLGTMRLAFTEEEAAALRGQVAALYAEVGEASEWLDPAAIRTLEPATPERVRGALYVPSSNGLYAPKYVRALAAGAAARGAAVLQGVCVTGFAVQGSRVTAVQTTEGSIAAGQVLLAAGAWTGIVSRWLGRPLPVGPERGQIMALAPAPGRPRVAHVLHGPGGYIIPKANGTACVGATHELVGFDARVTASGLKFLADLAFRLAPGLESATLKHVWMGFRPVLLRDGLPAVGRLPGLENAYVAAGHGAIGLTVSAAVGSTLAQLMRGEEPDVSLAPFDPARLID
jgi:glycine oxidase